MVNEPSDKLTEELSKFFIATWDAYCDNPSEELEWVIQETDLIARKLITQEDIDSDLAPEGHDVDDYMFVLTDLGKQARNIMDAASIRKRAELGVVKPQRMGQLSAEDRASMFIDWCALKGFPAWDLWPEGTHEQLVAHIRQSEKPFPLLAQSKDTQGDTP